MRPIKIVIGLLVVLFLLLTGVVGFLLLSMAEEEFQEESSPLFSVLEEGTASHYGYAVFNYRGKGNVTILSLTSEPKKTVSIINDTDAIQATRFSELVEDLRKLEDYGYTVSVAEEPKIGSDVYVVPTGAIPSYALFSLQQNISNGTVLYIGEKDLLISKGIKKLAWYDSFTEEQKERIAVYNGTLDEFIEAGGSLKDDILYETWNQKNNSTTRLSGSGLGTASIDLEDSEFIRLVYELKGLYGTYDSPPLSTLNHSIDPAPQSVLPWEKSTLRFSLNKTNGTAFLSIRKNGKVIEHELLRRVTDENVFIKKMQYEEPGEYIIEVSDNSGPIASGLLHVENLEIELVDSSGVFYTFSVTVDDEPLQNTEVYVSLGNSTQKEKSYVSQGLLVVRAKLDKGENVFNMEMLGSRMPVTIYNEQTSLLEFYLKYGAPGLFMVVLIYFGARMTRRPSYRLRFGEAGTYIRQEIRLPMERAIGSFKKIREDMNLGRAPITPHEFSVSLKRYLTNGADVTEGNVEEILKKLVKSGRLETHRDYYQLKGEGDVIRNVLRRMIREKLIESGTMFKESGSKFITKDYEIGFFEENFSKKGIVVVNDRYETKRVLASLSNSEKARLRILQSNGMITIVPIDKLKDVL